MGQNVLFLAMSLQRVPFVEEVILLDVGDQPSVPPEVDLVQLGLTKVRPRDVTYGLDVVIEMAGALDVQWLAHVRACGARAVYHCVGQPYVGLVEPVLFRDGGHFNPPDRCDEIWILPKDAAFAPMLRVIHRNPVHEVPYVWSPRFVEARAREVEGLGHRFGYQPRGLGTPGFRVAMFEPNISVVKTCSISMLVCDRAYREEPECVAAMHVLNTLHLKDHPTMLHLANSTELVRHSKATFHGRHDFVGFMVQHADAVVSHQWQNNQNYSYLDALYGGYPLVHNSTWLRDAGAGYYYPDFDVAEGAVQLRHAFHTHDRNLTRYRSDAEKVFDAVSPDNPSNIDQYARRLLDLVGGDSAFKASSAPAR